MNKPPIIHQLEQDWDIELLPAALDQIVLAEDVLPQFPAALRATYHEAKVAGKGAYYIADGKVVSLNLTETNITKITIPAALAHLQYLDVSDCEQLAELRFEVPLPKLKRLDVSDSQLTRLELPAGFAALQYLDISRNRIRKLSLQGEFPLLNYIDASGNQLKNFPPPLVAILGDLPRLEYLYLNDNSINPSVLAYFTDPNGTKNYVSALQQLAVAFAKGKVVENKAYKVLVVGDGKVGKTCFVKRLIDNEYVKEWDSTHGIAVKQFSNQHDLFHFDYILNIWDFGGQDIYHATHRLFMQRNTIYLLFWNQSSERPNSVVEQIVGKGRRKRKLVWENKGIKYWLRYIAQIGGQTPVIIAQTHSNRDNPQAEHPEMDNVRVAYRNQFDPLIFLHLDSKSDDIRKNGYRKLLREMEDAIEEGLQREEYLPEHWLKIKQALRPNLVTAIAQSKDEFLGRESKTLPLDEYLNIATRYGEGEHAMKLLNNWLVKTGYVFYQEGLFNNEIILDQEWAIRAIYTLFDREGGYCQIEEEEGRFSGKDLMAYWETYTEAEQRLFVSFMLGCELCFEIEQKWDRPFVERQFIAPQMLSKIRPRGFNTLEKTWQSAVYDDQILQIKYCYSFLQYGIIQQFIARTHSFTQIENIYRYGVIIDESTTGGDAIIEANNEKDEIIVKIPAKKRQLLAKIHNEFAKIHKNDITEYGSLDGKTWLNLKKLQEKTDVAEIETEDGKTVKVSHYMLFLPPKEKEQFEPPKIYHEALLLEYREKINQMSALQQLVFDLVANNQLREAVDLIQQRGNAQQQVTSIGLKRQLAELRNNSISGILTREEENRTNNRIAKALLDLISKVDSPSHSISNTNPKEMYGLSAEIESLESTIDEAIKRKKYYLSELNRAIEPDKPAYRTKIESINRDIADYRKELQQLQRNTSSSNETQKNDLARIEKKIDTLQNDMNDMHTELRGGMQYIYQNTEIILQKQDELLIQQLELSDQRATELAFVFKKIEDNRFSKMEMELLTQQISQAVRQHQTELPPAAQQNVRALQEKSDAIETDVKGKFKMTIPLIPYILKYETEVSMDLRQIAQRIWRGGYIF